MFPCNSISEFITNNNYDAEMTNNWSIGALFTLVTGDGTLCRVTSEMLRPCF